MTPWPVLGLATGAPVGADVLIEEHRARHELRASFGGVAGAMRASGRSSRDLRAFIRRALTDEVDLQPSTCSRPDVWAEDLLAHAREHLLAELGGVGVQLFAGIELDGHQVQRAQLVAGVRTRIKTLTEATRRDIAPLLPVTRRRHLSCSGRPSSMPATCCSSPSVRARAAPIPPRPSETAHRDVPCICVAAPPPGRRRRRSGTAAELELADLVGVRRRSLTGGNALGALRSAGLG